MRQTLHEKADTDEMTEILKSNCDLQTDAA